MKITQFFCISLSGILIFFKKKIEVLISFTLIVLVMLNKSVMAQTSSSFTFDSFNSGEAFTSIAVDRNNTVWAGTNGKGIFSYNSNGVAPSFSVVPFTDSNLDQVKIQSIASDTLGNIWVGQGGIGFNNAGGGLEKIDVNSMSLQHFSPDRNAKGFAYFERDGIASLNVKEVDVDPYGTVWLAQWRHQLVSGATSILTPGSISYKKVGQEKFITKSTWSDYLNSNESPELPYPAYTHNPPISKSPQSRNCHAISSDSSGVWVSVFGYVEFNTESFLPARLLAYDSEGVFQMSFLVEDAGFPAGGVFNNIYKNNKKGVWTTVSIGGRGFSVYENGVWNYFDPSSVDVQKILPEDTRFNNNAIWGDETGKVYLGTNKGLLVYDGKGPASDTESYLFYTNQNNLFGSDEAQVIFDGTMLSSNILSGASERKFGDQWIATDAGIMRGVFGSTRSGVSDDWVVPSPSGDGFTFYNSEAGEWQFMDPSIDSVKNIIPVGAKFNSSAFWNNKHGNVFMGTDKGLLVYDGRGPLNYVSSYTFYTNESVMPDSPFEVVDPGIIDPDILYGYSIGDSSNHLITAEGAYDFKVGFIKFNKSIGACESHWRTFTDYTLFNAPNQCLNSVEQSSNQSVRSTENKIINRTINDTTYHLYQIDTKIGNSSDNELGYIFTVERIYEIMLKNSAFQAITPFDMPTEVLGDNFITNVTNEDVKLFSDIVNQETDRVGSVQEIMNKNPRLQEYDILDNSFNAGAGFFLTEPAGKPFASLYPDPSLVFLPEDLATRADYYNTQIAFNPRESIHESAEYRLYSSPEAVRKRRIFDFFYDVPIIGTKSIGACEGNGMRDITYDPVIMHVDESNYTITNYTMEGHFFHPGKITRTVYRDSNTGDIYIRTIGEGFHFCKGQLGAASGRLNTIMGMILFKNVDIRLRDAIESEIAIQQDSNN